MRIEGAGPHHAQRTLDDLGFVNADGVRDAVPERPEAQRGRDRENEQQPETGGAHVARLAPFAFSQVDSSLV